VIAWELLTGRRLFKKTSPYETYQSVIDCSVPLPSSENVEIDPAIDPIIMKAVAKDKEQRYPTAEAFGDAIVGYLHHRGKGSSPNDVSRFFDEHFSIEIEEHGARMRELISGREIPPVNWDEEEERAKDAANLTVDLNAKLGDKSLSLDTGDIIEDARGSSSGLSNLIEDLGDGNRHDGDDDMPAERTRIEANPLEKLRELEKVNVARTATGKTPKPASDIRSQPTKETPRPELIRHQQNKMPPSGPLPLPAPPTGKVKTPAAGARVITPPGTPKVPSGRFPDLSNLPTMIAEPDETPPPGASPELAPTAMAGEMIDPNANTSLLAGSSLPNNGQLPQQPPQRMQPMPPPSQQLERQSMQQLGQPRPSNLPMSYPVMDKAMSQEMAAGASVFPSTRSGRNVPDSGPHDSQRAADLASPVGPQYGGDVDWSQAAAMPARAIAPWMLGVIFVAALGIALTITIIIAKLVR